MNSSHRVAVIGCGYWGVNHVRVMGELPQVSQVVACDTSPARLEEIAHRFPGVVTTVSVEEVAADPSIDAVVVCTPATTHLQAALPLIEAGKHVLVEKPITVTTADAAEMISAARYAGVTLGVGHTFLYNPGVEAMRRRIVAGDAGEIHYLYARRCNLGPIRHDVDAMWDLIPHDISIFNHLIDAPPAWVSAVGSTLLGNAREDVGFVTIGYENGVIANIHASWVDPFKVRQVVVVGTRERILFDDVNPSEPVTVVSRGVRGAGSEQAEPHVIHEAADVVPAITPSEPLKNQSIDFLDAIDSGREPVSTGEIGLRVVEVMEAVDASILERGAPVPVNRRSAHQPG
jgi:predicted dehydrogenase